MRISAAVVRALSSFPLLLAMGACTLPATGEKLDADVASSAGGTSASGGAGGQGGTGMGGMAGGTSGTAGAEAGPPVYASCATLPPGSASGVYFLDPDGAGTEVAFQTYCDMITPPGGWALVYSSVGSDDGSTLPFWGIPYADRFTHKGTPDPNSDFYAPTLYVHGTTYRDDVVDLNGVGIELFRATAAGIDPNTMYMITPMPISGEVASYSSQFAGGWSSADHDGDFDGTSNCSAVFRGVTQHYGGCFIYNLGASFGAGPSPDAGWGPHLLSSVAQGLGLFVDGNIFTRVRRISRWARW